jgi:hypothetical protein
MEEEKITPAKVEEKWDIQKIIAAILLLTILISAAFYMLFVKGNTSDGVKRILGIGTENEMRNKKNKDLMSQPSEQTRELISDIQKEISNLNPQVIASSSPQIQRILEDIKQVQILQESKNPQDFFYKTVCGR